MARQNPQQALDELRAWWKIVEGDVTKAVQAQFERAEARLILRVAGRIPDGMTKGLARLSEYALKKMPQAFV